jgi:hypothetical protein
VFLPAHLVHDLGQGSAVLALEHRDHLSGLTALARGTRFRLGWFRSLGAFGGLLDRSGLLTRLTLRGAPLAPCASALAFLVAFGFSLLAFSSSAGSEKAATVVVACSSIFSVVIAQSPVR